MKERVRTYTKVLDEEGNSNRGLGGGEVCRATQKENEKQKYGVEGMGKEEEGRQKEKEKGKGATMREMK
ncbi:hypothetical protein VNO78_21234 [Psophocarpus tetragonolobus]|uniref:Uncharacterized protein n=1 Tax=Psophocarpus tetragonolobus TaxID=3891 RepID=A0AAN9SBD0_PSOTE